MDILLIALLCVLLLLTLISLVLVIWAVRRLRQQDSVVASVVPQLQAAWDERLDHQSRELRADVGSSARDTRSELAQSLSLFQQGLLAQSGDVARTQNEQIDSFRVQLAAMQQHLGESLANNRESQERSQLTAREAIERNLAAAREAQDRALMQFREGLALQLQELTQRNDTRLAELRQSVERQLQGLQEGNEKKLEQMRATVDEKLQATLEARLGESFAQVAQRLEQVHRGLGEMQTLAAGVGDLKHLLSNVKTRGIFGEAQLEALLEQVFTREQYESQVITRPGTRNAVDFAIRLPGKSVDGTPLWLPIDAKFPNEDYARLLDAQAAADAPGVESAARALEARIRAEAKSMADKYLEPPHTTDFAILFLPTEGLYAEVLRRPGLVEALQRDHRITLAGPTTLLAMLSALQMGFRTLALEKRSSEVWQVLGAVKTEFGKFGGMLEKVKIQTETVLKTLDTAKTRTNMMNRALRSVEQLPEVAAEGVLGGVASLIDDLGADESAGGTRQASGPTNGPSGM